MGCGRKSSLLLERQARGPIMEEQSIAKRALWQLEPETQAKVQERVEVSVTYASPEYLDELFKKREVFGTFAGSSPYFYEQIVFYVKVLNQSGKKLHLDPNEFVLLDDRGNQYQVLSPDYNTALAEAKAPVTTVTRGVLDDARPGYFGVGLPVGKIIGKPQRLFAVLKMASLQAGFLYDGVVYDGLVAFWSPHQDTQRLTLLVTNLKTEFDANDLPNKSLEFPFEFTVTRQLR